MATLAHWHVRWHGAKLSTAGSDASAGVGGGGSTAMSTGVTNAFAAATSSRAGLADQISTKAAGTHTHAQADVTNLTSTLAALSAQISTKAAGTHTHAQADITNLESTLAALSAQLSTKAAGSHTHAQSAITDLESTLAALSAQISTKAAGVHTHAIAGAIPSTWVVLSTNVLTGSTAMADVAGMVFAVSSASMYRFEFTGAWQTTSSAVGIGMSINAPANMITLVWERSISTGLGPPVVLIGNATSGSSAVAPNSSANNVDGQFYVGGIARTGASAGNLALRFGTETSGSTVSVRAGSVGFLFGPL